VGPLQFRIPEIRPATLADAVILDELLPRCTRYVLPGFSGSLRSPLPQGHLASLDRMLVADGTAYIVSAGIEPLAMGGWSRRDRDPGAQREAGGGARLLDPETEAARVLSLAVRTDFTSKGLAAGILEECAVVARAEGFRRLAVMAIPEAVAMCIRCGFEEVARRTVELDSQPVAAVEMELRLR
jgi:hypothetical protein